MKREGKGRRIFKELFSIDWEKRNFNLDYY